MKPGIMFPLVVVVSLAAGSCAQMREGGGALVRTSAIVLKNCTLIDGSGSPPRSGVDILIRGETVANIAEAGKLTVPTGSKIFDLKGATVLPGFINAHVHRAYDSTNLRNWAKAGVTTVRDLAPMGTFDFIRAREEFRKNPALARIVSGTPILSPPGGYGGPDYYASPEDAKAKVLGYAAAGADIIKFSIEDELQGRSWKLPTYQEVRSIVEAAHSRGKKAAVHIMHARNLRWAIDAGVDDVAHMVVEPVDAPTIEGMVKRGIYWVPTLELIKGISEMYSLDWDRVAIENLSRFYRAGGKVALGTDFAGYSCSFDSGFPKTEVLLMKRAGMENKDIIVAGTRNAATVCGLDDQIGTVEEGKKADLLVVDGDPLSDITALFKARMVLHSGVVIGGV